MRLASEWAIRNKTFQIGKTITIGGKTKGWLLAELEAEGFSVGECAKAMIAHESFTTTSKPRNIDLVCIDVRDLDLPVKSTREVWSRARELGLMLCPSETGPHLRLAFTDQPIYSHFCVAMEQITVDGFSAPLVFQLDNEGILSMGGQIAWPGRMWFCDSPFIFVLPRK